MKDLGNIIIYCVMEGMNYLLAYVILFQANVCLNLKKIIGVGSVLALYVCIMLHYGGTELAMGTIFVPLVLIPLLLIKNRKIKWLSLYPIIVVGISIVSVGSSFLFAIVLDVSEYELVHNLDNVIIWQLIPAVILVVIYLYQRNKDYSHIAIEISKSQYIVFYIGIGCAFINLSISQLLSEGIFTAEMKEVYGFTTSLMSIVFVITGLWQGIIVNRENYYKERNVLYETYMRQQDEHIKEIIEQDEKMRRFRHDLNAHLIAIKSYCEEKNNQGLMEYLNRIESASAIHEGKRYTGNSAIDAVIVYLENEANKKGIRFAYKGECFEEHLVSEFELCTILSNLLKNAIEACEKLEDVEKRYVNLQMYSYDWHIFIRVKNPIEDEVVIKNNSINTTKEDNHNHGFGIGNINNAVKRLHGNVEYKCDNGHFVVEVLF